MVIAFDLDDTLFEERSFVRSGFQAVAEFCKGEFGWDSEDSKRELAEILTEQGRGRVFDAWLSGKGCFSKARVDQCVSVYRKHNPVIELYPEVNPLLEDLRGDYKIFIVTDGNKLVQARKISALGLWDRVDKVFITRRYGLAAEKPSLTCFERIRELTACQWSDFAYVGDNPAKDFVSLNPLGARTVRVLTGQHRNVIAPRGHEASMVISSLRELKETLER